MHKTLGGGPVEALLNSHFENNDVDKVFQFARDSADGCVYKPENLDPLTRTSWIGSFMLSPPWVINHHLNRKVNNDFADIEGVRDIPVLYIHGEEDTGLLWEPILEYVKATYKNVEGHILEESAHAPFYEKPEEMKIK